MPSVNQNLVNLSDIMVQTEINLCLCFVESFSSVLDKSQGQTLHFISAQVLASVQIYFILKRIWRNIFIFVYVLIFTDVTFLICEVLKISVEDEVAWWANSRKAQKFILAYVINITINVIFLVWWFDFCKHLTSWLKYLAKF